MIKVYDFDKTLTYRDTTMIFLFHCCNISKNSNIKKLLIIFFAVLHKVRLINNDNFKSLSYGLVFKRKNKQMIVDASKEFVKKNYDLLNLLGKRVSRNTEKQNYIVTASPQIYVQMYFKNMPVIGTTFLFDPDDYYRSIEVNCYGNNKVKALVKNKIYKIDEFYTDSFSDRPVMEISKKIFLVRKDKVQELKL